MLNNIHLKRQKKRQEKKSFESKESSGKPKCFVLDMFPYPSGAGLHVGHFKGYIATDIIARKKLLQGYNVLHPMGWDAFGLPAEQYAIKNKVNPKISTAQNIARYKEQLQSIGPSYDWEREIDTTDPNYYHWTQRTFVQLYHHWFDHQTQKARPIAELPNPEGLQGDAFRKYQDDHRLAYVDYKPINRCPSCKTGLANEDLEDGKCERCGSEIERKPMRQRVIRITDYAERLLVGLDTLSKWPESIVESQRHRIGKSLGTIVKRKISGTEKVLETFTTRVDTIFGVSFVAIAPEFPGLMDLVPASHQNQIEEYIKQSLAKTELQRKVGEKNKSGVDTGIFLEHPLTGEKVPLRVADYVLAEFGTGVVMGVPAHDERDRDFAKKYDLPVTQVIKPVFYETQGEGKFRPEKPVVERETVGAIIQHREDSEKFLVLDWKQHGWKTFVLGGVENGMTSEQAIIKEIQEETGFTDIASIEKLPDEIESYYYAAHKDQGRRAFESIYLVKLGSEKNIPISEEELSKHTVTWVKKSDLAKHINTAGHIYFLSQFLTPTAWTEDGILINSGTFSGLGSDQAREKITEHLFAQGNGNKKVIYKLQERVFSRQRYWGEPIPMLRDDQGHVVPLLETDLPLQLPDVEHYEPTGTQEGPLATIGDRVHVTIDGKKYRRETNTMPQRAGSSRYWLRYLDPRNDQQMIDPAKEKYRGQVDYYVGGAEHATRHLLYARFWYKFLHDIGVVSHDEPFERLQNVGLIIGEDQRKMSKRRGNVINPDDIITQFGADTLRIYEMFMGPFDQEVSRSTNGLKGVYKFLERVVAIKEFVSDDQSQTSYPEINHHLHVTIKKITDHIEEFKFNTCISQCMIFVNAVMEKKYIHRQQYEKFLVTLAPFAPHTAEEIRSSMGMQTMIYETDSKNIWPQVDESALVSANIELPIQINGKTKGSIQVSLGVSQDQALETIKQDEKLYKYIDGQQIKKVIFVQDKIVNLIVS